MDRSVQFKDLEGKTLTAVHGLTVGSDTVTFVCDDGTHFRMYHSPDCCESVSIEDVNGDPADLLHSPICVASEDSSTDKEAFGGKLDTQCCTPESCTWTFYTLRTQKGTVSIRWYGESNGYYSESVDFVRT